MRFRLCFIIPGAIGFLSAYGYMKTFSFYLPCAIHLGWNFTGNFIFPDGNIGNGFL
jgi:membrane protease YdiL (CAAX protease family)